MGAIQDVLDKYAKDTVNIIQVNMRSTGTNASGDTSRSVRSEPTPNHATVTGARHVYVVETGRKPGKQPPRGAITKWLQSGKVDIQGSIQSAAFAISKVIGEKGSKLWQEGGRQDIITPALSDKRLNLLTSEIADIEFGKTIKSIEDGINQN